jgi:AcrR family transcriptional regulator
MPNTTARRVRESRVDPRVARTTSALGAALIALLQERDWDAITVGSIVERAGLGRTAFYAHYQSKEDALVSSYERVFSWLEGLLDRPSMGTRLFPVAELVAHVGAVRPLVAALQRAGRLEDVWALFTGYAVRMVQRRLDALDPAALPAPRPLLARMLAGALVESVRWWLEHPEASTPAQVDAAFHALADRVLADRALAPAAR